MKFAHSINEARVRACPMKLSLPTSGRNCVASDCMAWRWVRTHIQDSDGNFNTISSDTHGYCGMATDPTISNQKT